MKRKTKNKILLLIIIIALTSVGTTTFYVLNKPDYSKTISIIDYSTTYSTVSTIYQRKTFYADGFYWLFYCNGTDSFFTSSPDGLKWQSPTLISPDASASAFSVMYENGKVHFASAKGPSQPVVFREGQIQNNQLSWTNEEILVKGETNFENYNAYCAVDSQGNPWVSYMRYDDNSPQDPWTVQVVTVNSTNDQNWIAPQQITSPSFFPVRPCVLALPNKQMYAILTSENGVEGKMWNGTQWLQTEIVTNRQPQNDFGYSTLTLNTEVHLSFLEKSSYNIYHYTRLENGTWIENLIEANQDSVSSPILSKDTSTKEIYCLWVQNNRLNIQKMQDSTWKNVQVSDLGLTSPLGISASYEFADGKLGVALLERMPNNQELYRLKYFALPNT